MEFGRFSREYTDNSFWDKCRSVARAAGTKVMYAALLLFFAMQDPAVPKKAKGVIMGALGYFIFPLDAIADVVPVMGYADDIGVLMLALATIAVYISKDTRSKARAKLVEWFGSELNEQELADVEAKITEENRQVE